MSGADIAIKSARYYDIPIVVRLGYLPSVGYKIEFGVKSKKYKDSIILEKSIFQNSHKVITTTNRISSIITKYDIDIHRPYKNRVEIIKETIIKLIGWFFAQTFLKILTKKTSHTQIGEASKEPSLAN